MSTFSGAVRRRDFALLEELRGGREEALAILYRHYASTLYDFVYSKTELNDVSQEIVQEIFISLWQKRSTLVIETSLRQYLFWRCRSLRFLTIVAGKWDSSVISGGGREDVGRYLC